MISQQISVGNKNYVAGMHVSLGPCGTLTSTSEGGEGGVTLTGAIVNVCNAKWVYDNGMEWGSSWNASSCNASLLLSPIGARLTTCAEKWVGFSIIIIIVAFLAPFIFVHIPSMRPSFSPWRKLCIFPGCVTRYRLSPLFFFHLTSVPESKIIERVPRRNRLFPLLRRRTS